MGRRSNRHFSKENIPMANMHMKRYLSSLIIREMQIKWRWGITSHLAEWPSFKNLQIINARKGGEKGTLVHCWWEHELVQPPWKTAWRFLKKLRMGLPRWLSGQDFACQRRRHRFNPWSRRIPQAARQLSPWATTTDPILSSPGVTTTEATCRIHWSLNALEPVLCNKRGCGSEKPARHT